MLVYSACFDTPSCSILYDKLERYGIRGVSVDFIKAYYENRSQYVCYDVVKSPIRSQDLGVIQGSKLALFLICLSSDFSRMCSNDESVLYANDTMMVNVGTSL